MRMRSVKGRYFPDSCRSRLADQAAIFCSVSSYFSPAFRNAIFERFERCPPLHTAALKGSLGIVDDQVGIECHLRFLDCLEPGLASFDREVFIQQRAMKPFNNAVRLGAGDLGPLVPDPLQSQEQLIGMPILAPTELPAVIAEHSVDRRAVVLKGRQHIVVKHLHGGHGSSLAYSRLQP